MCGIVYMYPGLGKPKGCPDLLDRCKIVQKEMLESCLPTLFILTDEARCMPVSEKVFWSETLNDWASASILVWAKNGGNCNSQEYFEGLAFG